MAVNDLDHLLDNLSPAQQALLLLRLHRLHTKGEKFGMIEAQPRRAGANVFPMSYAQERLWLIDQLTPGHPLYNICGSLRFDGEMRVGALEQSLGEILRRHEILRTTLRLAGAAPSQVVVAPAPYRLPVVDLSGLPESLREEQVRRLHRSEAQMPFSLATGPLVRLTLLRLAADEHLLFLTLHHVIADGWSLNLLMRELVSHYTAFVAGEPSPLAELPIQYADFAVWQREWLRGEITQQQVAYWTGQLAGAPALLKLPLDKARSAVPTYGGAEQTFALPAALIASLQSLGQSEDATLFMTLLAAFQVLLHRVTGQSDIPVGVPVANRTRAEVEELLGFFVNTLVMRANLSGAPSFREALRRVRRVCLESYAHQDLPFEKLVVALRPERVQGQNPLFQVMFNFQPLPPGQFDMSGMKARLCKAEFTMAKFDLSLQMWKGAEEVSASLIYNTDVFEAATVERLLINFRTLLDSVVRSPDAPVSVLELLSGEESARLSAQEQERKKSYGRKLGAARRKGVVLSPQKLVKVVPAESEQVAALPVVISPEVEKIDLVEWLRGNREMVEHHLSKSGAVLFRGFNVDSPSAFESVTRALVPELLDYRERTSPRTEIARQVYTSTEYPCEAEIPPHNELAYSHQWPMKIWFCCQTPSREGGETPLADSRRVLQMLDPRIRERFERSRVLYVRNFNRGIDLPWQEVFQTSERSDVEEYCRAARIEVEWKAGDELRLRQVREAVSAHPLTQQAVWFNQVLLFHPSSLPAATRDALLAIIQEESLPKNCYYGDGKPIEASVMEEIREAYRQCATAFSWQRGDLLMVDNMLVAHGRRPFTGPRKILVAMAEPRTAPTLPRMQGGVSG